MTQEFRTFTSNVISRKSAIEILVVTSILIIARLAFDVTSAAAYVYPEFDFGQSRIAFVIFVVAVPWVLILASVRLFQKHVVEAVALLIVCYVPFRSTMLSIDTSGNFKSINWNTSQSCRLRALLLRVRRMLIE
jgi:hypothetical protein